MGVAARVLTADINYASFFAYGVGMPDVPEDAAADLPGMNLVSIYC